MKERHGAYTTEPGDALRLQQERAVSARANSVASGAAVKPRSREATAESSRQQSVDRVAQLFWPKESQAGQGRARSCLARLVKLAHKLGIVSPLTRRSRRARFRPLKTSHALER